MEEKSLSTITSPNTHPITPTSTGCRKGTLQTIQKTHLKRCHETSSSNQHVPVSNQHLNPHNNKLVSNLDHHVLRDSTTRLPHNTNANCSLSFPVQQFIPITHSGLTTNSQSTLSMPHYGLHTIVSQDIYKENHYAGYHTPTQVHCSVARRKVISSNRHHPWRNCIQQPIRAY